MYFHIKVESQQAVPKFTGATQHLQRNGDGINGISVSFALSRPLNVHMLMADI